MNSQLESMSTERFVHQVRSSRSIDFPSIARSLDLDWFTDIKPKINTDPLFASNLRKVLEELRYELMQKILDVGMNGKKGTGRDPEITYINAIIKHIDSGALLGESTEDFSGGLSDRDMERHLKRLNILGDDNAA